jgi:hypothetical protein
VFTRVARIGGGGKRRAGFPEQRLLRVTRSHGLR